jgi:hypothetical protein
LCIFGHAQSSCYGGDTQLLAFCSQQADLVTGDFTVDPVFFIGYV